MLDDLYAGSVADAAIRSETTTIKDLEVIIDSIPAALDSYSKFSTGNSIKVIAEIKRASPSKGDLATIEEPAALGMVYENAGATAISVLTEQRKFKGRLDDFKKVRSVTSIPLLRKDFIANEYQVLEARAYGADLVLLIVAGLNQPQLKHLKDLIEALGMQALVETHSLDEVKRAVDVGAQFIGVNARNLDTFETDLSLFERLVDLVPQNAIAIAESAVRDVSDVINYANQGAQAVLVGEALVKGDSASLIRSFASVSKIRI
jgi:indole-3-glycerol phosphate synthase